MMGLAIFAKWKNTELPALITRLKWAFVVSMVSALITPSIMGEWKAMVSFGLLMAFWVTASACVSLIDRFKSSTMNALSTIQGLPKAYLGMIVAHVGVAVFIIGVTLVNGYGKEQDLRMTPGQTVKIDDFTFEFKGVSQDTGPNYMTTKGRFIVTNGNGSPFTLEPEKRSYDKDSMPMTEAAINPGLIRDLYISLGEPLDQAAWAVRIYIKPFVQWIWAGCLLMAAGGILALLDPRYRRRHKEKQGASS
jgi:cytochrome c-type biogenesis protein CcmF